MFIPYSEFTENLRHVRGAIEDAAGAANRSPAEVTLLPVTKNHPVDAARYALRSGLTSVGENRVQEALAKMEEAAGEEIRWELIGPLQSNKAKKVAEHFFRVQSVDREKIVKALEKHAAESGRQLRILLQVNAGDDPRKSGVSLEEAPKLLECALEQANLSVEGLMTIAPLSPDPNVARECFAALRRCRDRLSESFRVALPELSMGMSGDLKEAILEGSTIVRVGSALYGERNYA